MTSLYDALGHDYARWRRPDPRIAEAVRQALGDASSVLNVGAGAGSYEPRDRSVIAAEPSPVMLAQRPAGAAPALRAIAEALPLATGSVDASLAALTHHHWTDWRAGMRELARVARRRIVVLTHDMTGPAFTGFWLVRDYLPPLVEHATRGFPPLEEVRAFLGASIQVVPVPADCTDGFLAAYWGRPYAYLNPAARAAISYFHPRLDARPPTSVHAPMPAPTTLSELIALYLARCRIEGLSPRTQRAYSETLARFQRSVGSRSRKPARSRRSPRSSG